jgi:hypothetical protein
MRLHRLLTGRSALGDVVHEALLLFRWRDRSLRAGGRRASGCVLLVLGHLAGRASAVAVIA